jgi:hypothetical protein
MRSEAQKASDKRYFEKNKGRRAIWETSFTVQEVEHIETVLKEKQVTRAELVRRAIAKLEKDEL